MGSRVIETRVPSVRSSRFMMYSSSDVLGISVKKVMLNQRSSGMWSKRGCFLPVDGDGKGNHPSLGRLLEKGGFGGCQQEVFPFFGFVFGLFQTHRLLLGRLEMSGTEPELVM